MKSFYLAAIAMVVASLLGATGQILFKKATGVGLVSKWMLFGVALYGIGFLINIVAYKYGDASKLYPIISFSYLFVAVLASIFLGEVLTWNKVVGACVIVCGVALMFFL
jgi:undecaprenyl phosphate-alpha-L-ara4N flippase subunit ArnE